MSSTSLSEKEVMEFFQSLMEASHVTNLFAEKFFLPETGLTMIQFGILKQLMKKGGSVESMTDLWCDNHTTRGNLTGVIQRMIAAELVTRIEDSEDRRKKHIAITEKGRKVLHSLETKMQSHIPKFLEKIGDLPLQDITKSLKTITNIHLQSLEQQHLSHF